MKLKNRFVLLVSIISLCFAWSESSATEVDLSHGIVWGANGHATWGGVADGWVPLDTQMQNLQAAGLKIYRLDISHIDQASDSRLRAVIEAADNYGIQVLPVLLPLSHDGDGNLILQDKRVADPANAYAYSYSLGSYYAKYFGSSLPVFEIGNEYDDLTIYRGTDGASYSQYDPTKFWIAHESLRGLTEGIKGVSSALKTTVSYTWCHYAYADMMWYGMLPNNPTMNAVSPVRWDITGQHWYYGMNDGNLTAAGCWAGPTNILEIDRTHFGKPIWLSEFGDEKAAANHDKPTMVSHVESMMERVSILASKYNIQTAILYELYDSGVNGAEGSFGICASNGDCNTDFYKMVRWYTSTQQYQLNWQTPLKLSNSQCVDVQGDSNSLNALIGQYPCVNQSNQQWIIRPYGAYYQVISKKSGLCLDVAGKKTANGSAVDQWTCVGDSNQLWSIRPLPNGKSQLVSADSNRCLDVPMVNYSAGSYAYLTIWDCHGGENQQFGMDF